MIAEDNAVNQFLATAQLKKLGYAADTVANGIEVLEAFSRIPYDIILMDCQMPELDGYETTRQVRSRGGHQPVIIAMTANAMQGDRELCLAAGMDSYISKPMRIADLKLALAEAAGLEQRVDRRGRCPLSSLNLSKVRKAIYAVTAKVGACPWLQYGGAKRFPAYQNENPGRRGR